MKVLEAVKNKRGLKMSPLSLSFNDAHARYKLVLTMVVGAE